MRRLALLSLLVVTSSVACGSPPPPAAVPKPKPIEVVAEPPPDLSPVAEPRGLLVLGRIAHAEEVTRAASGWTGMPLPTASQIASLVAGDEVGSIVDVDKPLDFAVSLSGGHRMPKPQLVVSVAVRSMDDARGKLAKYKFIPMSNGMQKVEGLAPPGDDDAQERVCVLSPAAGAGARLVCGDGGAIESFAPYMLRTVPTLPTVSDLHAEVRMATMRDLVEGTRRLLPGLAGGMLGADGKQPATREIVEGLVGDISDFAADAESYTLDVEAKPEGAKATLRLALKTSRATLSKLAIAAPRDVGPPPAELLHLPADVDMAAWTKTGEPALLDRPREIFGRFVAESMENEVPDTFRKTLVDLMIARSLPLFQGAWVYGRGFDLEATRAAISTMNDPKNDDSRQEYKRRAGMDLVGFHLIAVDKPASQVGAVMKDWASFVAKIPARAKPAKGAARPTLKVVATGRELKLPKDTVHLEFTGPREPPAPVAKGKKAGLPVGPVVCHAFAVPDGAKTWIGVGCNPKLVAEKLASSLSSAPATSTLGARPEARALLASRSNRGFFFTPRTAAWARAVDRKRSPFTALDPDASVPALVTWAAEPPSPAAAAGGGVLTVEAPKAAIGSIVGMLIRR